MTQPAQDTSVEAEYADGYIHSETEHKDISAWDVAHNTFWDILEHLPEAEHGRLVRFSVYYHDMRYDVDWTMLPENARPIRFRDGQSVLDNATNTQTFGWVGCRFGYQYNDATGKNHQEIQELA